MLNSRQLRKLIRAYIKNNLDYLSEQLRVLTNDDINMDVVIKEIDSLKISTERKETIKEYFVGYVKAIELTSSRKDEYSEKIIK